MRAVVEGLYGVQNLGDDYLLCSIIQTLSKVKDIKNITVICSGGMIDEIVNLFPMIKINIINREPSKSIIYRIIRKIKTAFAFSFNDVYIFGGGGLFPVDEPRYYMERYQKLLQAKKLGTRKIVVYGVDICGMKDDKSKIIWREIADITDYLNFRNQYSAVLVNECLADAKATYASDISFSYTSPYEKNENDITHLLETLDLQKGQYIIWALAMPWNNEELKQAKIKARYDKLVGQIAKICNRYKDTGYINVFLPFFHASDCNLIDDVKRKLNTRYLVLGEHQIPLEAKRALFKYARACVSMRFHGIAFSLYHGLPVAAISYAPKSTQLMYENNLNEYCTEFGIRSISCFFREFDINEEQLVKICDKAILENKRQPFKTAAEKLNSEALKNEKRLLDLLR